MRTPVSERHHVMPWEASRLNLDVETGYLNRGSSLFLSVVHANSGTVPWSGPRTPPLKSLSIYHSRPITHLIRRYITSAVQAVSRDNSTHSIHQSINQSINQSISQLFTHPVWGLECMEICIHEFFLLEPFPCWLCLKKPSTVSILP
jgi:hypothetical protein